MEASRWAPRKATNNQTPQQIQPAPTPAVQIPKNANVFAQQSPAAMAVSEALAARGNQKNTFHAAKNPSNASKTPSQTVAGPPAPKAPERNITTEISLADLRIAPADNKSKNENVTSPGKGAIEPAGSVTVSSTKQDISPANESSTKAPEEVASEEPVQLSAEQLRLWRSAGCHRERLNLVDAHGFLNPKYKPQPCATEKEGLLHSRYNPWVQVMEKKAKKN